MHAMHCTYVLKVFHNRAAHIMNLLFDILMLYKQIYAQLFLHSTSERLLVQIFELGIHVLRKSLLVQIVEVGIRVLCKSLLVQIFELGILVVTDCQFKYFNYVGIPNGAVQMINLNLNLAFCSTFLDSFYKQSMHNPPQRQ